MRKEYTNGDVTVLWDDSKCVHSANCIRGLPGVFDVMKSPWINMHGASSKTIVAQVAKCPSGALSMRDLESEENAADMPTVKISVQEHGPLIVEGDAIVALPDGTEIRKKETFALCRCGASGNKPYCDGSHKKRGF